MSEWTDRIVTMLGKRVRVTLDRDEWIQKPNNEADDDFPGVEVSVNPNPKPVVAIGDLISFSEMGEVLVIDDSGDLHHCWPLLEIELDA